VLDVGVVFRFFAAATTEYVFDAIEPKLRGGHWLIHGDPW
jgi:hypothetical protein